GQVRRSPSKDKHQRARRRRRRWAPVSVPSALAGLLDRLQQHAGKQGDRTRNGRTVRVASEHPSTITAGRGQIDETPAEAPRRVTGRDRHHQARG
ncbi:unnamed protein product, partial [Laminaria digitata]